MISKFSYNSRYMNDFGICAMPTSKLPYSGLLRIQELSSTLSPITAHYFSESMSRKFIMIGYLDKDIVDLQKHMSSPEDVRTWHELMALGRTPFLTISFSDEVDNSLVLDNIIIDNDLIYDIYPDANSTEVDSLYISVARKVTTFVTSSAEQMDLDVNRSGMFVATSNYDFIRGLYVAGWEVTYRHYVASDMGIHFIRSSMDELIYPKATVIGNSIRHMSIILHTPDGHKIFDVNYHVGSLTLGIYALGNANNDSIAELVANKEWLDICTECYRSCLTDNDILAVIDYIRHHAHIEHMARVVLTVSIGVQLDSDMADWRLTHMGMQLDNPHVDLLLTDRIAQLSKIESLWTPIRPVDDIISNGQDFTMKLADRKMREIPIENLSRYNETHVSQQTGHKATPAANHILFDKYRSKT